MNATKIEIWDVPTMTAPNFSRPGGIMEATFQDDGNVHIVQKMPNPASDNLPFIVVADTTITQQQWDVHITPTHARLGCKLIETWTPGYAKLVERYGRDLKTKLPLYKTAKYQGEFVRLVRVDLARMDVTIQTQRKTYLTVPVDELNDFCL